MTRGVNRRRLLLAAATIVALASLFTFLALTDPLEQRTDLTAVGIMLEAATVALAALLAVLLLLRFRLTSDAVALWAGTGMLVVAAFTIAAGNVLPLVETGVIDTHVLAWVRPASIVVALGLFVFGVSSPEVDTRLRVKSVVLVAVAAVTGLTLLLQLLPGIAAFVLGEGASSPAEEAVAGAGISAAIWAALAIVYVVRGIRDERHLFAWLGMCLAAFTLASLTRGLAPDVGSTWQVGAALMRTVGLTFGLVGAIHELQLAFASQSTRLHETHVDSLTREARMQAELAAQAERAHEARNALAAIEGATLTLDRNREALEPAARTALVAAVSTEIARLQRLVSAERAAGTDEVFPLGEVVEAQLALLRARGARALSYVPEDVVAFGRAADVAEALQNLLFNAHKHAPGSPIVVRAVRDGDSVVVRVEDRGPGVAEADQARVFERGVRANLGVDGDGLGLYVARQLVERQGGSLWLEARTGPGASFAMALPSASGLGREPGDEIDEVAGPGEMEGAGAAAGLDRASAGGAGILGQPHDDVDVERSR